MKRITMTHAKSGHRIIFFIRRDAMVGVHCVDHPALTMWRVKVHVALRTPKDTLSCACLACLYDTCTYPIGYIPVSSQDWRVDNMPLADVVNGAMRRKYWDRRDYDAF